MPIASPQSGGDGARPIFSVRLVGADPERVIFFLSGDLAGAVCPSFEHFARSCVDSGTRRLRLDLAELRSLDLDGVNALLAVHDALFHRRGRLILTNVSADVMTVLRLFARPLMTADTSVIVGLGRTAAAGDAAISRFPDGRPDKDGTPEERLTDTRLGDLERSLFTGRGLGQIHARALNRPSQEASGAALKSGGSVH